MRARPIFVCAALLATLACAGRTAVPRPFPAPRGEAPAGAAATAGAVARTALALAGRPYRTGGADPAGFDCSGLVHYVFARHGVSVPRTVAGQFRAGQPVRRSAVVPGDLLFFSTTAPGPSHVAVALGGDEFVHAPGAGGQVRVERLGARYWLGRFVGARRVADR